jgi:alkylation response protein AidB-like acyl-CoA dehydrogenase
VKLDLTEDQEYFRVTTRKFLESEVPLAHVRTLHEDADGFDRDWWHRAAGLGWTSMLVPERLGGGSLSGEGLVDLAIVAEEMGRLVSPGPLVPCNLVAAAISVDEPAGDRMQVLAALISGETIGAFAIEEPGGRWQATDVTATATEEGDGFLLDGVKSPVEAGAQAEHLLVAARTIDGVALFLVPRKSPNLRTTPMNSIDMVRRFAEVRLDGVKVPKSSRMGAGDASGLIERLLQVAIVLQAAEVAGTVDRAFEFTLQYLFERLSFGRPLASYQALKHRAAELKVKVEAFHGITTDAALAVEHHSVDAAQHVSAAKAFIGAHATEMIQDMVQLTGGIGITWEHDIHMYLRRATANRAVFGTPDQHRVRLAALAGL